MHRSQVHYSSMENQRKHKHPKLLANMMTIEIRPTSRRHTLSSSSEDQNPEIPRTRQQVHTPATASLRSFQVARSREPNRLHRIESSHTSDDRMNDLDASPQSIASISLDAVIAMNSFDDLAIHDDQLVEANTSIGIRRASTPLHNSHSNSSSSTSNNSNSNSSLNSAGRFQLYPRSSSTIASALLTDSSTHYVARESTMRASDVIHHDLLPDTVYFPEI